MDKKSYFEDIIRCKWSSSILLKLGEGVRQPGELERSISGLTKKVLYQRLKKLERYAFIKRELISEKPLKVFYRLTPTGRKVVKIIKMVREL